MRNAAYEEDLATAAHLGQLLDELETAMAQTRCRFRQWQTDAASAIVRVEVAWAAHIRSSEAPDGFLAQSERDAPRVTRRLREQAADHTAIAAAIRNVYGDLLDAIEDEEVMRVRADVVGLRQRVNGHLHRSDCLAWEIANEDLGFGD